MRLDFCRPVARRTPAALQRRWPQPGATWRPGQAQPRSRLTCFWNFITVMVPSTTQPSMAARLNCPGIIITVAAGMYDARYRKGVRMTVAIAWHAMVRCTRRRSRRTFSAGREVAQACSPRCNSSSSAGCRFRWVMLCQASLHGARPQLPARSPRRKREEGSGVSLIRVGPARVGESAASDEARARRQALNCT